MRTFDPLARVKNSVARGWMWGLFIPQGFMNPADMATPRLVSAGKVLRLARSPWPPRPLPPPGLGLAAGLKSYLSQVSAGPREVSREKRSSVVGAVMSLAYKSSGTGGLEGGTGPGGAVALV